VVGTERKRNGCRPNNHRRLDRQHGHYLDHILLKKKLPMVAYRHIADVAYEALQGQRGTANGSSDDLRPGPGRFKQRCNERQRPAGRSLLLTLGAERDHIDFRQGDSDRDTRGVRQLPGGHRFGEGTLAGHAVDGHDGLETVKHGRARRVQDRTIGCRADRDQRNDAVVLERLLQIDALAEKLVGRRVVPCSLPFGVIMASASATVVPAPSVWMTKSR
jgi:hypothetical protein